VGRRQGNKAAYGISIFISKAGAARNKKPAPLLAFFLSALWMPLPHLGARWWFVAVVGIRVDAGGLYHRWWLLSPSQLLPLIPLLSLLSLSSLMSMRLVSRALLTW
jgi:hypothetical protein